MNICRSLPTIHAGTAHHSSSGLPKRVREIGLDKIGFDVLADTHNVCYALCLKNWQLDEDRGEKNQNKLSYRSLLRHH